MKSQALRNCTYITIFVMLNIFFFGFDMEQTGLSIIANTIITCCYIVCTTFFETYKSELENGDEQ